MRAKVWPKRRERKESTLSSRAPTGRFEDLNGSLSTAGRINRRRGEVNSDVKDDGRRRRPEIAGLDSDDVGMYKKRACAAGAVLGTVMTLSSRLSRCIYISIRVTFERQKKAHTSSRTDLLLGRKVRGPASRRIEVLSLIVIRSERTHPPSRVCFSIKVTFAVGKRRAR